MITIHCSNPICGKSFLYDEEKFPGAKKVQCPYCKTIQDLVPGVEEAKEEPEEETFFEEPKKTTPVPPPEPAKPKEVESFAPPVEEKGEDFSSAGGEAPPTQVASEPKKLNPWLIIVPVLVVAAVVLAIVLWPSKTENSITEDTLAPMPGYQLTVVSDNDDVEVGDEVTFSFSIAPLPDSGMAVRYFAGETEVADEVDGEVSWNASFSEEGEKELVFFAEVLRLADSALVSDTDTLTIKVEKRGIDPIVIDIYRQAHTASWTAVYPKNPPVALPLKWKEPLEKSGDFYGQVQRVRSVKMENGKTASGVEIATGDKRNARIYGEFKVSKLPAKPEFSAWLGYRDAKDSGTEKGEVIFEFSIQFKDGTIKKIGEKSKKYNERFTELEFFIDPKDAPNVKIVRLDLIGNKRSVQRVVLMNPRIAEK
jgi:hypothetical protein